MRINDLFFEFSNEGRFEVFKSLYKGKKRHSQLEKDLDIRGSEISRHLKRLMEKNLIKKSTDSKYAITNIGKLFLDVLELFEVSLKFESFFNTHNIDIFPLNLILQLGNLKSIKISSGTMQNIELWADMIKNSEKYILAISDQFQDSILPAVERKINNISIDIRALVDKNVLNSKGYEKLHDRHTFYQKINITQNIRMLKQIEVSLLVTDKGAILFLGKEGKIDYSECLFDENEIFIEWSKELFEWYWKKGINIKSIIRNR
ncbi:MAG: transcriptional regulator FilR1 domain-containing protein [Candidatus Lokiarchaeia archaeon]|nr:transcriptional regulator FilR1 domain-containing protein [Candidatus Lokiarchaeia archaeon]